MRNRAMFLIVPLIVLCLIMVAGLGKANAQEGKKLTFYYVDHGVPSGPFWPVWYQGIEDATEMLAPLGVEVKHLSAGEADRKIQIEMLKQAVAANPDGLITSMMDPESFGPILKPLIDKGVPIFAVNIEDPRPAGQRIPYLAYYGEENFKSGTDLADALITNIRETGGKKPQFALFICPAKWHLSWEARFQKFSERLAKEYGTKSDKIVDMDGMQMRAYVKNNPKVDVICAHAYATSFYISQLIAMGKVPGKDVYLVCFDLYAPTIMAIQNGQVVAAHDQQQYLQGYLPLFDLYLYLTKFNVHPVNVTTGIIIDKHNADSVLDGSFAGYR